MDMGQRLIAGAKRGDGAPADTPGTARPKGVCRDGKGAQAPGCASISARATQRRPIQRSGCAPWSRVSTRSFTFRASTGRKPRGVRMRVPWVKQVIPVVDRLE